MEIAYKEAKSILTPQQHGFLAAGPYPFTHALSAYTGCGFGQTTCGLYCYAQFLPNWAMSGFAAPWGQAVQVETNAPQLLEKKLKNMAATKRQQFRIFMSSTTDPYQPIERTQQVTRGCLEVFARYPNYRENPNEWRDLKAELYKVLLPKVSKNHRAEVAEAILKVRRR